MLTLEEAHQGLKAGRGPGIDRIPLTRVRLLWASGYWDGPMNGLALLDQRVVWFDVAEDLEEDGYRAFWLVDLNDEQLRHWTRVRDDFEKLVGMNMTYGHEGLRGEQQRGSGESSLSFWELHAEREDPCLWGNQVLGWFVWK